MRLHGAGGKLVKGRCRATNLCDYCARLAAVEWSEMLALDALDGDAPQLYAVLTTRSDSPAPEDFYRAREYVLRELREVFPNVRYCAIVEFTTGRGPRSGGKRRPHWNLLLKGVPVDRFEDAERIIARTWCRHVDAEPWAQFVGPVSDAGGLMRYLALHFLKDAQRPPAGWRHKQRVTFSTSRNRAGGYFTRPVWKVRKDAQRALRVKRELWKLDREGIDGNEAAVLAEARVFAGEQTRWELVHITVDEDGTLRKVTPAFGRRYPFGYRIVTVDLRRREREETAHTATVAALAAFGRSLVTLPARTQLVLTGNAFRRGP
jgi:hypothetical protein